MGKDLYEIVFRGEISKDFSAYEVKKELGKMFKLSEKKVERMFSGKDIILKSGLNEEDAEKYMGILKNTGLICFMEKIQKNDIKNSEKNDKYDVGSEKYVEKRKESYNSYKKNNIYDMSVMSIRDLIEIENISIGDINSSLTFYEAYIASTDELLSSLESRFRHSQSYDNRSEEIKRNDFSHEGHNLKKTGFVRKEDNHSPDNEKYSIVFSGIIKDGISVDEVKEALRNIYGVEQDDLNILFSKESVVLKRGINKNRSLQYIKLLNDAGAEAEMIKI